LLAFGQVPPFFRWWLFAFIGDYNLFPFRFFFLLLLFFKALVFLCIHGEVFFPFSPLDLFFYSRRLVGLRCATFSGIPFGVFCTLWLLLPYVPLVRIRLFFFFRGTALWSRVFTPCLPLLFPSLFYPLSTSLRVF